MLGLPVDLVSRAALNRLGRFNPASAAQTPELRRIVGFRNVLVHGYAVIDDELV